MPIKPLPAEVWAKIIAQLPRPLPRPTGNNARSTIRQPELAAAMSTCKLFNNLAAPHLYSVVVSDHLPSLLYGINAPAIEGVQPKSHLLGCMERLFLEYHDRFPEPSYADILNGSASTFESIGAKDDRTPGFRKLRWAERDWIGDGLARLGKCLEGRRAGEKGLKTLSMSVFLDAQNIYWLFFEDEVWDKLVSRGRHPLPAFVQQAGVAKVCQRATCGPLSCSAVLQKDGLDWDNAMVWNTHVADREVDVLPAAIGGRSSWFIENRFNHYDSACRAIAHLFIATCGLRDKMRPFLPLSAATNTDKTSLDLTINVPRSFMSDRGRCDMWSTPDEAIWGDIRAFVTQLQEGPVVFDLRSAMQDKVKIGFLKGFEPCEACGWSYEDLQTAETT